MLALRRILLAGICLILVGILAGCSLFHDLQPHRLWRWNYGVEGMPASDYE